MPSVSNASGGPAAAGGGDVRVAVTDLDMAYGDRVIQRNLSFTVRAGEVFIIMGGSGCGKSTLLRHLIGPQRPARGDVLYGARTCGGPIPRRASGSCPVSGCSIRRGPSGAP